MVGMKLESGPAIDRGLYDFIDTNIYVGTNVPILMRVGLDDGAMFEPIPEGAMPPDVLGLPQDMCEEIGVDPYGEKIDVFIMRVIINYLTRTSQRATKTSSTSEGCSDGRRTETSRQSKLFCRTLS
jgi:hypothetical protein